MCRVDHHLRRSRPGCRRRQHHRHRRTPRHTHSRYIEPTRLHRRAPQPPRRVRTAPLTSPGLTPSLRSVVLAPLRPPYGQSSGCPRRGFGRVIAAARARQALRARRHRVRIGQTAGRLPCGNHPATSGTPRPEVRRHAGWAGMCSPPSSPGVIGDAGLVPLGLPRRLQGRFVGNGVGVFHIADTERLGVHENENLMSVGRVRTVTIRRWWFLVWRGNRSRTLRHRCYPCQGVWEGAPYPSGATSPLEVDRSRGSGRSRDDVKGYPSTAWR